MQNGHNENLSPAIPPVTVCEVSPTREDSPVDITQIESAQLDAQSSADVTASDNNMELESLPHQVTSSQLCDSAGVKASNDTDGIERGVVDVVGDVVGRVIDCVEDEATVLWSSTDTVVQNGPVDAVDRNVGSPRKEQVGSKTLLVPYRDNEEDTSSSDSSSSSSSSDSDIEVITVQRRASKGGDSDGGSDGEEVNGQQTTTKRPQGRGGGRPRNRGIKTPGELDIDDLPPIEELHITLPRTELRQAGHVKHAVDQLLVVESEPGQPPLDLDSVLFRADGTALGRVFDVLGPVAAPYYTVRFNSAQELSERALEPGEPVLYAPLHADVTHYVLEAEIRKQRGSDASWENNNEPPPEHLDFSDDEQEREVRKQLRAAKATSFNANGMGNLPGSDQRARGTPRGRGRGRGRGAARGGHNREQQTWQQQPDSSNGTAQSYNEGLSRPVQFHENRGRPQWPPSSSPHQRWPNYVSPVRFQPSVTPPPNSSQMSWTPSPQVNSRVPNIWNTPPPSSPRPPPASWQNSRPWLYRPPMFPDLRTPPPNFGRAMPQATVSPPCHSQAPFPSPQRLHANTAPDSFSYQQSSTTSPHGPNSLPSPIYDSSGQRVPLYDPVPDLQRILATPPPPPPPPPPLRH